MLPMTALSIGVHVSVACSTNTTAQRREGFDRDFGYYGFGARFRQRLLICS